MKNWFQVQRGMSADLKTVTESVRRNCIALKGVINVPHVGFSGALQNLNQNFRNQVRSWFVFTTLYDVCPMSTFNTNIIKPSLTMAVDSST